MSTLGRLLRSFGFFASRMARLERDPHIDNGIGSLYGVGFDLC